MYILGNFEGQILPEDLALAAFETLFAASKAELHQEVAQREAGDTSLQAQIADLTARLNALQVRFALTERLQLCTQAHIFQSAPQVTASVTRASGLSGVASTHIFYVRSLSLLDMCS